MYLMMKALTVFSSVRKHAHGTRLFQYKFFDADSCCVMLSETRESPVHRYIAHNPHQPVRTQVHPVHFIILHGLSMETWARKKSIQLNEVLKTSLSRYVMHQL